MWLWVALLLVSAVVSAKKPPDVRVRRIRKIYLSRDANSAVGLRRAWDQFRNHRRRIAGEDACLTLIEDKEAADAILDIHENPRGSGVEFSTFSATLTLESGEVLWSDVGAYSILLILRHVQDVACDSS